VGDAIAMTDKDVLTIKTVYSTMAGGLICLFVTFKEEITSTITHVNTLAVEVRAFYRLTATYGHTIVALAALTTIIP
jgi:hypothetical protein